MDGPLGIGERIRELRLQRGLTLNGLARGLKIVSKTGQGGALIRRWETGKSFPSYWNLIELSRFFGITLTKLCDFYPHPIGAKHEQADPQPERTRTIPYVDSEVD